MLRNLLHALLSLAFVSPLAAHFVTVVPDEKDPTKARVVLSDDLKPDGRVDIARIARTKLFAFDAAGAASPLAMTVDAEKNTATVEPGSASLVGGTCEYGVVQRGETGGVRISHHPKYIVGDPATTRVTLAGRVPVEIVPQVEGGKVRFLAMGDGRPLAKTSVTLLVPGSTQAIRVLTDERGLTPAYDKRGQWGAQLLRATKVTGEFQGKQYGELREYATLVMKW